MRGPVTVGFGGNNGKRSSLGGIVGSALGRHCFGSGPDEGQRFRGSHAGTDELRVRTEEQRPDELRQQPDQVHQQRNGRDDRSGAPLRVCPLRRFGVPGVGVEQVRGTPERGGADAAAVERTGLLLRFERQRRARVYDQSDLV